MNINDWKVIQMRNDVKYIKRNVKGTSAANWSLVVDVFLVLLAFVLDRIFSNEEKINCVWVTIAILGVCIPLLLFVIERIKTKQSEKIALRVLNSKELIEVFDDEICYMIMSAETFNNNLKQTEIIDSRQAALLLEFYTIEASYYLNKAVQLILKMDNNLTNVLDQQETTNNHISRERFINAISLLANIYEDLIKFSKSKESNLTVFSVDLDLSETKRNYYNLKKFAVRKKDILSIDIDKIFELE